VRASLQQRKTAQEIQNELNIRFYVERIIKQARAFSAKELLDAYHKLYDLENSLKSAISDERFVLEKSLYDICATSS
jgi:DNA polymerase III delta subunit